MEFDKHNAHILKFHKRKYMANYMDIYIHINKLEVTSRKIPLLLRGKVSEEL